MRIEKEMKFTLLLSKYKKLVLLKKYPKLLFIVNFILICILSSFFLIGVGRSSLFETNFEFGISYGDELVYYSEYGISYNDPLLDRPEKHVNYQKFVIGDISIIDPTSCRFSYKISLNITNDPDYENLSHWDTGYNQTVILNTSNMEQLLFGPFLPLDIGFDDIFTKESFSQMYGGFGIGPNEGDYEIVVHENSSTFSVSELRLSFEMIFDATIDGEHRKTSTIIKYTLGKNHIIESADLSVSTTTGNFTTETENSLYLIYSNIQSNPTFYDIPNDGDMIQTILLMTGGISLVVIAVGIVSYISYIGVLRIRKEGKIRNYKVDISKIEKIIYNHNFNEAHQNLLVIHQELEILGHMDYSQKIENLMKTCRINAGFFEQRKTLIDKFNQGEIRSAYTGLVQLLKEVNKPEFIDWIDPSVTSEIADSLKKVASNL